MAQGALADIIAAAFTALEQSSLGAAARGSAWLYPLANLGHVLGAALLVGAIATFDIQVLRRAKNVGIIARAVTPVAAFGLALQVASGTVLLAADAMPVVVNPAFQFKMAMFALGLINVAVFRWRYNRTRMGRAQTFPGAKGNATCSEKTTQLWPKEKTGRWDVERSGS